MAEQPLPHLRDLRYFLVLAEYLHFTNAAAELQISQPTLSQHIQALEDQLGVALVDRRTRAVALTVAGRELLTGARRILADWDETAAAMQLSAHTLRVGLQSSVDGRALATLAEGAAVRLEPLTTPWVDPTCGLGSRESDVAVMFLPVATPERYEWLVLSAQRRWVVLPENHRLADRPEIAFADIADEQYIALPPVMGPLREYWLGGDVREHAAHIGATASSPEERLELIQMGQGICLVAQASVPLYQFPGVAVRPVVGLPNCELALVWHADDENPHVRDFVAHIRESLTE